MGKKTKERQKGGKQREWWTPVWAAAAPGVCVTKVTVVPGKHLGPQDAAVTETCVRLAIQAHDGPPEGRWSRFLADLPDCALLDLYDTGLAMRLGRPGGAEIAYTQLPLLAGWLYRGGAWVSKKRVFRAALNVQRQLMLEASRRAGTVDRALTWDPWKSPPPHLKPPTLLVNSPAEATQRFIRWAERVRQEHAE